MSEEEHHLFARDQYVLWERALENLEMQLNGFKLDSHRDNELVKVSILDKWEKRKSKWNDLEDVYKKFNEAIQLWIYIKKQIDPLNKDNLQHASWIRKEKRKEELFGHTKQVCLWQEIEDFINSMENLHMLIKLK